jgi:hypothetical protein
MPRESTAPCGRLVMLLDHVVFTRDVTVLFSTSTRIEPKVAMSGRVIAEIWKLLAPGLSEEALGADIVYGQRGSSDAF